MDPFSWARVAPLTFNTVIPEYIGMEISTSESVVDIHARLMQSRIDMRKETLKNMIVTSGRFPRWGRVTEQKGTAETSNRSKRQRRNRSHSPEATVVRGEGISRTDIGVVEELLVRLYCVRKYFELEDKSEI